VQPKIFTLRASSQGRGRLLEVVVALGRNFVVLEALLPVEGHHLGLHLPVLHVHLVATQDDRDVLANPAG
jgi:hypothetical protein